VATGVHVFGVGLVSMQNSIVVDDVPPSPRPAIAGLNCSEIKALDCAAPVVFDGVQAPELLGSGIFAQREDSRAW